MNQQDRDQVAALVARLEDLKANAEAIGNEISTLAEAEQEKFDNMNEGLQQSEQGQGIEAAAGFLDEAVSALTDGDIGEALEALGNLT